MEKSSDLDPADPRGYHNAWPKRTKRPVRKLCRAPDPSGGGISLTQEEAKDSSSDQ